MTFIHPGLHEALMPNYYVIDVKRRIVVVQFQIEFVDEQSGEKWPPLQASAHYHLVPDESEGLKIKLIKYWTQSSTEDLTSLFDLWNACKEKALLGLAMARFDAAS
jgi:hypothetical protein